MDSYDPKSEMHHSKVGHMKELIKSQFEYTYLDFLDSVPKIFVPNPKKKENPSTDRHNIERKGFQEAIRHFKIPEQHADAESGFSKQKTAFLPDQRIGAASLTYPLII